MRERTRSLWEQQNRHPGDRHRLFAALADTFEASRVLYPGSFVDIAPSFVFESVTYVDTDRRAAAFFDDADGVNEIIGRHRQGDTEWRFIRSDYAVDYGVPLAHFDLLISLYAGFVSEHCSAYLRAGGLLVANPSHGDVAMASIDPHYRLAAVVNARSGRYSVRSDDLETYLIPRQPAEINAKMLQRSGRGIAYTRSPYAYVFQRRDI